MPLFCKNCRIICQRVQENGQYRLKNWLESGMNFLFYFYMLTHFLGKGLYYDVRAITFIPAASR